MSKICGYTCEHNKGGLCQLTSCNKKIYMTTKTEKPVQEQIEILTRWQDPTIQEKDKEIERLKNEKAILEKAFRLVIQHDIGEINYAELDRANKTIEEFYKNNNEIEMKEGNNNER